MESALLVDCAFRVYIYELPKGYRHNGRTDPRPVSLKTRHLNDLNGHPWISSVEGSAVMHGFPRGVRLWNSGQFSTAAIIYQRVLEHRCRTRDPATADLFLIPSWSIFTKALPSSDCNQVYKNGHKALAGGMMYARLREVRGSCPDGRRSSAAAADRSGCSALEARGGADHVLLSPRNGVPFETHPTCELDYSDARLGAATRLAIEEPSRGRWQWFDHYATLDMYHSVPHVSNIHLDSEAAEAPWRARHRRHVLVAAAFGVGHGNRANVAVRRKLQAMCERAGAPALCTFHSVWEKTDHARFIRTNLSDATSVPSWVGLAQLYWNATFCLQPFGDAVSRKGVLDALVLGCIPVLFHEGLPLQWPDHWGNWAQNASIVLDWRRLLSKGGRALDVIRELRAVPHARIAEMQRTIAEHAHRIHFSAVDTSKLPPYARGGAEPPASFGGAGRNPQRLRSQPRQAGQMHQQLRLRHRLRPGTDTSPGDAVDALLEAAAARAKEPARIAAGIALQQAEGRKIDAAERQLRDVVDAIHAADAARSSPGGEARGSADGMGYCGHAGVLSGDCAHGSHGRLPLRNTTDLSVPGMKMALGLDERTSFVWPSSVLSSAPASIDECSMWCKLHCSRCNYVSYSLLHGTCEWYEACNMERTGLLDGVKRLFGGDSFVSRKVKK